MPFADYLSAVEHNQGMGYRDSNRSPSRKKVAYPPPPRHFSYLDRICNYKSHIINALQENSIDKPVKKNLNLVQLWGSEGLLRPVLTLKTSKGSPVSYMNSGSALRD
jgi:hypothetical protein